MKIWTKIEWAIIVAASVLLLLLLLLFAYNHPHSDDFSYNLFLQQKGGIAAASEYIFNNNNGRFLSSLLIFLSPLKVHSIVGYQSYTLILFIAFLVSLWGLLFIIFKQRTSVLNIIALFSFVCLCFFTFTPNLHEFIYWLCAEATYLVSASLWLWAIVLHFLLAQKKYENKIFLWVLCVLNSIAIVGCSESGIFLYLVPLVFHFTYRRQQGALNHKGIYIVSVVYFLALAVVLAAPGNFKRHSVTPFSGNILLAFSGGVYAAGFWLIKWAIIFMPILSFYILIFGYKLIDWAKSISSRFTFLKAKTVFWTSIIYFLFCQILVVWMSGSTPEQRFENVMFLFLLLAFLLSAQLFIAEQSDFFLSLKGKLYRGFKTFAFLYLICVFGVITNNFQSAFFDVISGRASNYNQENYKRYLIIQNDNKEVIALPNIQYRPKLLYFPTLGCSSIVDTNDIMRLAFAEYFGKKWIYEYPCNTEIPDYSIKELLKQKRQQFFSKEKK